MLISVEIFAYAIDKWIIKSLKQLVGEMQMCPLQYIWLGNEFIFTLIICLLSMRVYCIFLYPPLFIHLFAFSAPNSNMHCSRDATEICNTYFSFIAKTLVATISYIHNGIEHIMSGIATYLSDHFWLKAVSFSDFLCRSYLKTREGSLLTI